MQLTNIKSTYSVHCGLPRWDAHQSKLTVSPSCSLDQPLCTCTFHLGIVGSFGRWVLQPYHNQDQQLDSLPHCCPLTPVGPVGCTTLSKWVVALSFAHSALSDWTSRRSASHSGVCQTGECCRTAGKLQTLTEKELTRETDTTKNRSKSNVPRACARMLSNRFIYWLICA